MALEHRVKESSKGKHVSKNYVDNNKIMQTYLVLIFTLFI